MQESITEPCVYEASALPLGHMLLKWLFYLPVKAAGDMPIALLIKGRPHNILRHATWCIVGRVNRKTNFLKISQLHPSHFRKDRHQYITAAYNFKKRGIAHKSSNYSGKPIRDDCKQCKVLQ